MTVKDSAPPDAISSRVVAAIPKAEGQELRISLLTLPSGRRLGDLRLFCSNQAAGGTIKPTRKGVTFSPALLAELRQALAELERAIHLP